MPLTILVRSRFKTAVIPLYFHTPLFSKQTQSWSITYVYKNAIKQEHQVNIEDDIVTECDETYSESETTKLGNKLNLK